MKRIVLAAVAVRAAAAAAGPQTPVASSEGPSERPPAHPNDATAERPRGATPVPPREPAAPAAPGAPPVEPPSAETSDGVAGAPVPGHESGRIDGQREQDSVARRLARGALFVPELAVEVGMAPIRGTVWAFDRYRLEDRYYRTFFNRSRTFGIVPIADYQTGFGVLGGVRLLDSDTFGDHEHVTADAAYGGEFHDSAALRIDSGRRLGRVVVGIGGNFDRRPADRFYGIGNRDPGPPPAGLIDPRIDSRAVLATYRYQEARAFASVDVPVVDSLHVTGRAALTQLAFDGSGQIVPIDEVYDPAGLVGFSGGVSHVYEELDLRWDGRRRASLWEPRDLHADGSLASLVVGEVHQLDGKPDFTRVDVELQKYFRLAPGPHVLAFRFLGEAVTGTRDQVPFTELPSLGGDFLRGYPFQRFRDRASALGTVEYWWDLSHFTDAYLFADVGRVYPGIEDLSLAHLRAGFGVGLELHDSDGFIVAGSLASSIDGGIVVTATFTPVLDERPRWR